MVDLLPYYWLATGVSGIEQQNHNPEVGGSNPSPASKVPQHRENPGGRLKPCVSSNSRAA
jgi:hypothetical protein